MKQLLQGRRPTNGDRLSRSVLRHRDLRVLVVGRALSFLGDQVAVVALVLVAHGRGWGTTAVAAMFAASALPLALGAPLAGRIVDRYDSRTVTVAAAGWQAACAAGLAGVLLVDPGWIGQGALLAAVLALLLALNAGQAVAGPAWQALVPHAVPAADVGRAVGTLRAVTMRWPWTPSPSSCWRSRPRGCGRAGARTGRPVRVPPRRPRARRAGSQA